MSCWCIRPVSLAFTLTQSLQRFVFWGVSVGVSTVVRSDCCHPAKELEMGFILFSGHLFGCLEGEQSSFAFKNNHKDKPFPIDSLLLLITGSCTAESQKSNVLPFGEIEWHQAYNVHLILKIRTLFKDKPKKTKLEIGENWPMPWNNVQVSFRIFAREQGSSALYLKYIYTFFFLLNCNVSFRFEHWKWSWKNRVQRWFGLFLD